jgi:opacity protein-like surface antigen
MNNFFSVAAVVALVTTISFADDIRLGARAVLGVYDVSTSDGKDIEEGDKVALGFGGGLAVIVPLVKDLGIGDLGFRSGAEFVYRTPHSNELSGVSTSVTEFAFCIPAMIQYTLYEHAWLGIGVQLDIPFASKLNVDSKSSDFEDRSAVDFAVTIGGGYNITKNIGIDMRGTIAKPIGMALTKFSTQSGDESELYQGTIGLTYLF